MRSRYRRTVRGGGGNTGEGEIRDDGEGMTDADLIEYRCTVGRSGRGCANGTVLRALRGSREDAWPAGEQVQRSKDGTNDRSIRPPQYGVGRLYLFGSRRAG